jgi:type 1 fimbriae regulatory protein FimB/type 1 fimbriae regulatory protein FimE
MANARLRLVSPSTVNGTVPPRRQKNADVRTREYLTEAEVEQLMKAVMASAEPPPSVII